MTDFDAHMDDLVEWLVLTEASRLKLYQHGYTSYAAFRGKRRSDLYSIIGKSQATDLAEEFLKIGINIYSMFDQEGDMATRCKFRCVSITKRESTVWTGNNSKKGFVYDAKFQTVVGNTEENAKFFASTPGGEITVSSVREDQFQPGLEYYVDFSEAVPAA
jgi:hypothetical protein